MLQLAVLCLLVAVLMVPQDFLGSGLTIAESRGLSFYPGLFDCLMDFVGTYSAVASAVAGVKYGLFSWQMTVLVVVKMIVSFHATNRIVPHLSRLLPTHDVGPHPWRHLFASILNAAIHLRGKK